MMLIASENQNNDDGLYTETRLYVRALQGVWDTSAKHATFKEDGKNHKNVGIEQLKVQLKPKAAYTKDVKKVKDERSLIDFMPTDSEGYSYITLNSGGLGALTMSTGNDAYYGIGVDGRPTKNYQVLGKGRVSTYDSYSTSKWSDTSGTVVPLIIWMAKMAENPLHTLDATVNVKVFCQKNQILLPTVGIF